MLKLIVKNIKEVDEPLHDKVTALCQEKSEFFENLLKKYGKEVPLEVIFDHSSKVYKVSGSLGLKSKKVLVVEEDEDVLKAVTRMFNELKKAGKRQYELERKDYLYKRKR